MEYVVANREQNLSSDSYFYATFWNTETKTYEERPTGSTAGYGGGWLDINAPAEVMQEYRAVKELERRRAGISYKQQKRNACKEAGHAIGISFHRVLELFTVYGNLKANKVLKLLVSNTKSKFKQSLKEQIIDWLNTPKDERKYNSPL